MNKLLNLLLAFLVLALVTACGGSGNAGTSPFGSASSPTSTNAASIDVLANGVSIGSAGEQVTISAIVKDSGNVSLPSTPVTFSTDTGTLTSAATKTDSAGVATAVLSAGANRSNRNVTVSVRSGNAVGSLVLPVTGTVISYTGPTTVGFGKGVTASVKAVDSKGAPINGLAVAVSSSLNNGLSATTVTTDAQGNASVTYTASNAGADTLTFTGGGTSVSTAITVSAADFEFVDSSNVPISGTVQIPVGAAGQALRVRYVLNGVPQAGKTILFTSTAGTVTASAVTDATGVAVTTAKATTASPATVQATVSGGGAQATVPVLFIALVPAKLTLQVSPTALGPNVGGSTAQQARLVATVVDSAANPVAGVTVNFTRVVDPSGGNLSQPSALTDSSGQASVQFISGASTTASNGVQLQAQVSGTAVTGTATLTVNQSALFIALGTGNVIGSIDEQTYRKDWVVYVTDSNGIAVPNITLTIKVLPLYYGKGDLSYNGKVWDYTPFGTVFCANEDDGGTTGVASNAYNGVLDAGEDRNGDGRLQPGNVISVTGAGGVSGSSVGTFTTDATGRATISLIYAESYAPWVTVRLTASAVVAGTESSNFADFTVSGSAPDFSSQNVPPAGQISPFGNINLSCTIPG